MLRAVTTVRTLPFVRRMFISLDKRWFWTFITYALGSVHNYYDGKVLEDVNIDLLEEATDM